MFKVLKKRFFATSNPAAARILTFGSSVGKPVNFVINCSKDVTSYIKTNLLLRLTFDDPSGFSVGLQFKLNTMKHFLFTVVAFLLITSVAHSQHMNIGIKGGSNAYTIMGDNGGDFEPKISYHIGLLGHIHLGNNFALQPEAVFSAQGSKSKIAGNDISINMNYVNIPLIIQYMYDNGFRVQAGPQLGILVSANSKAGAVNTDVKTNYKSTDIGLSVGMSYVKPSTGFGIDIRYNHGLTNINKSDAINSYNRGIQVGIFYLFQHKS